MQSIVRAFYSTPYHIKEREKYTVEQSPWGTSVKKSVLKNFVIFKGKHLCPSLSFDKVACLKTWLHSYHKIPGTLPRPILESKGMHTIFRNTSKKTTKHLKIWAKMCKIWKYSKKGQVIVCNYYSQSIARKGPNCALENGHIY